MSQPIGLFEAYGVELEYMIVDAKDSSVRSIADRVLRDEDGRIVSDLEDGAITWSNELALHVIELKTTGPAPRLTGLGKAFHESALHVIERLKPLGARLLPGAIHPLMEPDKEFEKWPHDNAEIYATFDRIFDCRGHGWSNLQSVHLNLPFEGPEEFGRLHAAIRLVLPIIPALAASSPYYEGRRAADLDARLRFYQGNSARIPEVAGRVVPEPIFDPDSYERELLQPLYRAIAPYDPEGTLQEEWLNARGAIARFDRNTIEIRVTDTQECPAADLAVTTLIAEVVRGLVDEEWSSYEQQKTWAVEPLAALFNRTVQDAERARIDAPGYLELFGLEPQGDQSAGGLWRRLIERLDSKLGTAEEKRPLATYAERGTLARRLTSQLGDAPHREAIQGVLVELSNCLEANRSYVP